ncbi:hypothetical protein G4923_13870 [Aeromonas rivipollensis]|uniref:Rad50/SbcC-type AAA domain-containing protein n=1 Tax=Aeromonas rivipollensis TaxID=948519 RepID=A0ABX0D7J2_9GAMM|nr:hypothetical protein [Aeromonas rivipollensis]NEX89768.1 hypothetical protein [Aeromonas rivipollensis]NEY08123.1 hypothetical protein [Aeromonas rivipollensis]
MEKWRIHRLKINDFKVFSCFDEVYSENLVVYDGPNGFGKTSLFDAKQLLFSKSLPRISARVSALNTRGSANKKYSKNLYRHHSSKNDISIIAELKKGNESICVMRRALKKELERSQNKPNSFDDFKLYELPSFDDINNAKLVLNEQLFWADKLGDKFLNNFSVLNYLQQDSKSIIIPDKCDDRPRTGQIEHLINLDKLKLRIENISKLKSESKNQLTDKELLSEQYKNEITELEKSLLSEDINDTSYIRVTSLATPPYWDMEQPFSTQNFSQIFDMLEQVNYLKKLFDHNDEVAKRIRNKQKIDFTKREEFDLAIRLYHQFSQADTINKNHQLLNRLDKLISILNFAPSKLSSVHNETISNYLDENSKFELKQLLQDKNKFLIEQGGLSSKQAEMLQIRDKLILMSNNDESSCPLCGFDYIERVLLIEAVNIKTQNLKSLLDDLGKKIATCYQEITHILNPLKEKYTPILEKLKSEFNINLYNELKEHEHQSTRLINIGKRIALLQIELPTTYTADEVEQKEQIDKVKQAILKSLEHEDDIITNQDMSFYHSNFNDISQLQELSIDIIQSKISYIQKQYNISINTSILKKKERLDTCKNELVLLKEMNGQLDAIEARLKKSQTRYINITIGQMESLFHIYSGRLLQNYQSGLGIFIDMPEGDRKNATMNFFTTKDFHHDAALSMSSGQISALSLSLFLALNKKYAKTAFLFIDDPTQCMDEINIASLSDLLRVEFRDRQVIISTHEQDISNYLCYRYGKAGLDRQKINLLQKSKKH